MNALPGNRTVWFGVLGGATAWAVQFVVNLALTFAQCNAPAGRFLLPVHPLEIGLSAVAVAVGLLATAACVRLYRLTSDHGRVAGAERQGKGSPPPVGRLNFLAMVGLTVNGLTLAIVIMTGVGAPLIVACQQS